MDSAKLPSGRLSTEVSLPSVGDVCEKRKLEKTISGTLIPSLVFLCSLVHARRGLVRLRIPDLITSRQLCDTELQCS